MSKPYATYVCGPDESAPWDEPIMVSTVNVLDDKECETAGACDEPSEWLVELVGWNGEGDPPYLHPVRYACMLHVGFAMGEMLATASKRSQPSAVALSTGGSDASRTPPTSQNAPSETRNNDG